MICCRTFKKIYLTDFDSWEDWVIFVNENYKFSIEKSTTFDFLGKCKDSDLPSYHPYWTNEVKKYYKKELDRLWEKYIECYYDNSKIKYHFNITTRIEDIEKKIILYEKKSLGIVLN